MGSAAHDAEEDAMTVAVRVDRSHLAERLVLAGVTAIAALISYTHLRAVWLHTGAPWDRLGPLLPDGLFASAWLQMRRRRHQEESVGWLAWLALGVALLATLGGNVSAAVIDGHRDPLSLVVAALPAAVFTLAWELTTGHGRHPSNKEATGLEGREDEPATSTRDEVDAAPDQQESNLERQEETRESTDEEPAETWEAKRDRLLREGASRKRLQDELGLDEWPARKLQEEWKRSQESREEAAG